VDFVCHVVTHMHNGFGQCKPPIFIQGVSCIKARMSNINFGSPSISLSDSGYRVKNRWAQMGKGQIAMKQFTHRIIFSSHTHVAQALKVVIM
jgi:hypothetical protein